MAAALNLPALDHLPVDFKAKPWLIAECEFARFEFGFLCQHLMPERIARRTRKTLHAIAVRLCGHQVTVYLRVVVIGYLHAVRHRVGSNAQAFG